MILDSFISDIKKLVTSTEIKYHRLAKANETLESAKASDMYIAAYYETDNFSFYKSFDLEALVNAGLTRPAYNTAEMIGDKTKIPLDKRAKVVQEQRKIILRDYVELNEYYRPLVGLPPLSATEEDYIVVPDELKTKYNIDASKKYLHTLTDNELYLLKIDGYLDNLIKENPDKKYLKYIGEDRLNIIKIREAKNFEIIYSDRLVDEPEYIEFINIYDTCREYVNMVLYNSGFASTYSYYDNFMALSIMIMTIQKMTANTFKYGIQRDLYDWDFVRAVYSLYNIPFVEHLGMEYHQIIIKNLNNLLRYKATDKVLFDICSLLGHDRIKIYKYYLMKHRKYDDGKPVFIYKKVKDDDGNEIYVEDVERMYEIYFQQVSLQDENLTLALKDKENKLDYLDVTLPDPYWVEDEGLYKTLYEKEYNFVESKYIGLTIMYKFSELIFELTYAFRLVQDKKDELADAIIMMPKIDMDYKFNIFDLVIYLITLVCKRNGFKDTVITDPSKISHIYGFDFNEDSIAKIKAIITENHKFVDQRTLEYFTNLEVSTAKDVNDLFVRIREFNDFILNKMRESKSIKEYHFYKDIYTISMVSDVTKEMFEIDGVPATSYLEYLDYACPLLSAKVRAADTQEELAEQISYVISRLEHELTSMEYLYAINDNNSPLIASLIELIRFFKSYTVDLATFGIIYLMDSKYFNMLRLIDDYRMFKTLIPEDDMHIDYADRINSYDAVIDDMKTMIDIDDRMKMYVTMLPTEEDIFYDEIAWMHKLVWMDFNLGVYDAVTSVSKDVEFPSDTIASKIEHDIESLHTPEDYQRIRFRHEMLKSMMLSHKMHFGDQLIWPKFIDGNKDHIDFEDKWHSDIRNIWIDETAQFLHEASAEKDGYMEDVLVTPYDYIVHYSDINKRDRIPFRDKIKLSYE